MANSPDKTTSGQESRIPIVVSKPINPRHVVLSMFSFLVGSMTIVTSIFGAYFFSLVSSDPTIASADVAATASAATGEQGMLGFSKAVFFITVSVAVLQLIAGIGLLLDRRWGISLSLLLGVASVFILVLNQMYFTQDRTSVIFGLVYPAIVIGCLFPFSKRDIETVN
ncbi:MAG: hypothetical protein ABL888_17370 [Pirellulaceae bacterium]